MTFKIVSKYKPAGDQPKAIEQLVSGLKKGFDRQTLLGVTGSGKTFTIANVIECTQMPALVIAHNKTLAAQLCNEFREFFPENAVEYFVSYYDYYQPEAYLPHTDTYIEKEAQINEEIDRLRHACTQALLSRRDVIIVASVSAIYGLGSPKEYEKIVLHLVKGQELDRRAMLAQLVQMQFERTNSDLKRGSFRLKGQTFEIMPVNEDAIYRFEITDKIEHIEKLDRVARTVTASSDVKRGPTPASGGLRTNVRPMSDVWFFPAKHYVVGELERERAFGRIKAELDSQLAMFERQGKVLEHERLKRRVRYDLEMIKNIGYCNGIENYSRHFEGRGEGEPPFTLLDYFQHSSGVILSEAERNEESLKPKDKGSFASLRMTNRPGFLTIIDESHVTVPQIGGMFNGDRARKDTLVEHGFRLPSARDNRPLTFKEFEARTGATVYVSATPSEFEIKSSQQVVEQVVRPTGLIDPEVVIRPITPKKWSGERSQVEDLIVRIEERIAVHERVLVTTLTKKMAEDLAGYLTEKGKISAKGGPASGWSVAYLHSDIDTLERIEIITDLRRGKHDVIVGVNLLREGLDMPEVSLVAILDADKEGFLRSETSLIQTIGRAARNVNGQVVLYADIITGSMEKAIAETDRRRQIQLAYNKERGITPQTIQKTIRNILEEFGISADRAKKGGRGRRGGRESIAELDTLGDARPLGEIIKEKEAQMKSAAKDLEFELAAILRDEIRELVARQKTTDGEKKMRKTKLSSRAHSLRSM